eukprot:93173-Amphidinium_carterae.4
MKHLWNALLGAAASVRRQPGEGAQRREVDSGGAPPAPKDDAKKLDRVGGVKPNMPKVVQSG